MRRFAPVRGLAVVLTALALVFGGAHAASAATGDLTFKDCLAKSATSPCAAVPSEVLEGGRDVAVSPDGKYVYVASGQETVVGFTRSLSDGSIAYAGCIENGSGGVCVDTPNNTLLAPNSLAFSPDSKTLYVSNETLDTVVRLSVGSGGALSFVNCVEDNDALPDWGCEKEAASMANPFRVVVSPDGNSVYVASEGPSSEAGTINHLSATLQPVSCYREVPVAGCGNQAEPLSAPRGMGISPDGSHLYVTSVGRDAIKWFKREPDGTLTGGGCLADDDDTTEFSDNCTEEAGVNYDFMNHIAFNPDGSDAYVTDETSIGVVYHFTRDATTGALARQDCLADSVGDAPGCTELNNTSGSGLSSVTDAVVSPDGANLYAVAFGDSALSTFGLASPSGAMTFIRCLRANEFQGCTGFGESFALSGPFGVAISPDGHDVYVANGNGTPALLHFEREAPGTRTGGEPAPEIKEESASGITETDATLKAKIVPGGSTAGTYYQFQIVENESELADEIECPPFEGGPFIPCIGTESDTALPIGLIASGGGETTVELDLSAEGITLMPDTTYDYRVLAANAKQTEDTIEWEEPTVIGATQSLTTLPPASGEEPGPGPGPGTGSGGGSGSGSGGGSNTKPTTPTVKCNGLKATIVGTARADTIKGTAKPDVIAAGSGNDKVKGLGGKDVVCGEGGNDNVDGGAGGDVLLGGPGKDILKGAGGPDRVAGGPGADQVVGGPGRDSVKQ